MRIWKKICSKIGFTFSFFFFLLTFFLRSTHTYLLLSIFHFPCVFRLGFGSRRWDLEGRQWSRWRWSHAHATRPHTLPPQRLPCLGSGRCGHPPLSAAQPPEQPSSGCHPIYSSLLPLSCLSQCAQQPLCSNSARGKQEPHQGPTRGLHLSFTQNYRT